MRFGPLYSADALAVTVEQQVVKFNLPYRIHIGDNTNIYGSHVQETNTMEFIDLSLVVTRKWYQWEQILAFFFRHISYIPHLIHKPVHSDKQAKYTAITGTVLYCPSVQKSLQFHSQLSWLLAFSEPLLEINFAYQIAQLDFITQRQ
jgi:hypothetical protein